MLGFGIAIESKWRKTSRFKLVAIYPLPGVISKPGLLDPVFYLAQFRAKSVGDLFAVSGSVCLGNHKERVLSLYLFPLSCKLCAKRDKEPTGNVLILPIRRINPASAGTILSTIIVNIPTAER